MPRKTDWAFAQIPAQDPHQGQYKGSLMNYPTWWIDPDYVSPWPLRLPPGVLMPRSSVAGVRRMICTTRACTRRWRTSRSSSSCSTLSARGSYCTPERPSRPSSPVRHAVSVSCLSPAVLTCASWLTERCWLVGSGRADSLRQRRCGAPIAQPAPRDPNPLPADYRGAALLLRDAGRLGLDPYCGGPVRRDWVRGDHSLLRLRLQPVLDQRLLHCADGQGRGVRTVPSIIERRPALFFLGHISPIFARFFAVFSLFSPSWRQDSGEWHQKTGVRRPRPGFF